MNTRHNKNVSKHEKRNSLNNCQTQDKRTYNKSHNYIEKAIYQDVLPMVFSLLIRDPATISNCFIFNKNHTLTPDNLMKIFTVSFLLPVALTSKYFFNIVKQIIKNKHFDSLISLVPNDFIMASYALVGEKDLLEWAWSLGSSPTAVCANACAGGHKNIIDMLLEKGMDFKNDNQCCPSAATNGKLETLEFLVEKLKMPLTVQCFSDAIDFGKVDVLEYLYSKNCPIDPRAHARAAFCKRIDVLRFLKEKNIPCKFNATGPAADIGCKITLKWLVENDFSFDNNTCLYAVRNGHYKIVKWLIKNGAPWGDQFYETAVKNNQWKCIKYGLKNKLSVNPNSLRKLDTKNLFLSEEVKNFLDQKMNNLNITETIK